MIRYHRLWLLTAIAAFAAVPAAAQSFTNLDFESPAEDFTFNLPGWTISEHVQGPHLGVAHLLYSAPAPDEWKEPAFPFPVPADNQYSLVMQVGWHYSDPQLTQEEIDAPAISQTGLIPTGTQSIRLRATSPDPFQFYSEDHPPFGDSNVYLPGEVAWRLMIDGRPHPLYRLGDDWWGAKAAGHAGEVHALSISMNPAYELAPPFEGWPISMFDDITFSPMEIVPEPSAAALVGLGGVLVWSPRRWGAPLARRG